jgi:hypothetical protein
MTEDEMDLIELELVTDNELEPLTEDEFDNACAFLQQYGRAVDGNTGRLVASVSAIKCGFRRPTEADVIEFFAAGLRRARYSRRWPTAC